MNVIKSQFTEISQFLIDQHIIQLATAVIIGTQVNTIMSSLTTNIISPIILLILGTEHTKEMSDLSLTIYGVQIKYGNFLLTLINFFILVVFIYNLIILTLYFINLPSNLKLNLDLHNGLSNFV